MRTSETHPIRIDPLAVGNGPERSVKGLYRPRGSWPIWQALVASSIRRRRTAQAPSPVVRGFNVGHFSYEVVCRDR